MQVDLQHCSRSIPPEWPASVYHFGSIASHCPEDVVVNVGVRRDDAKPIQELFSGIFVINKATEDAIKGRSVVDIIPMKRAEVGTLSKPAFDHIPRNKSSSASTSWTKHPSWLGYPNYSFKFWITIRSYSHLNSLLLPVYVRESNEFLSLNAIGAVTRRGSMGYRHLGRGINK